MKVEYLQLKHHCMYQMFKLLTQWQGAELSLESSLPIIGILFFALYLFLRGNV